ncbi:MAG: glycosyltransferase family 2 protein [Erysipelotrichaceae bacterium]|nr:glycosyltransferase family 2 protein [Erysipelotrichaceae bacterium]
MEEVKYGKLVSIVMPLFNSEKYISSTIQSVISQTCRDWELIIVDDCSTDRSLELAKMFAKDESRIIIRTLPKNSGSSAARNEGISVARGRYLVFLDSDDLLDSNFLEKQVSFIESKKCAVITAGYRRNTENSSTNFIPREKITYHTLLKGNDISCLSSMIDLSITGKQYFDVTLLKSEDYLFWLTLVKSNSPAYSNQEVLATYRLHSNSKNGDKKSLIKWTRRVYRKLGFGPLLSWFFVSRLALYSKRKYRNVA